MTLQEFLSRLDVKSGHGDQYMAKCPAHDDKTASLSVGSGEKGIVIKCHAGCSTVDVLATMGLTEQDLFYEPKRVKERPHLVATYQYISPDGKQYEKQRFSDKSFTWRQPDGKGGWIYSRKGISPSLYGVGRNPLPKNIYFVEGEKDVDNLIMRHAAAVSPPDGAKSKWQPQYTEVLKGRHVVILPDNDAPGWELANTAAAELTGKAASVRILDLTKKWPDLPPKGDISDILEKEPSEDVFMKLEELESDTPEWTEADRHYMGRTAKQAADFGEDNTRFLWYPYLPIGDYTVMMADGGTGKTILCCGIIGNISTGKPLPDDECDGQGKTCLIISGEDSGEILKSRLKKSGANLNKVYILDRIGSEGMSLSESYEEFESTVKKYRPALVVLDPWHCFLGAGVDMSKVNSLRPILQKLSNLCAKCDCSMILISHVNKREQGANANNAAMGSADLINAARSAFRVDFDESDEDCRIMVHTKSNYAPYGQSVKYQIMDGGLKWAGFSEITRQTLELAARRKATPGEVLKSVEEKEDINRALIAALESSANQFTPTRFSYDEFKKLHGDLIFGGLQPKRALDAVKSRLADDGFFLKTGVHVFRKKRQSNGFIIQQIDSTEPEQMDIDI